MKKKLAITTVLAAATSYLPAQGVAAGAQAIGQAAGEVSQIYGQVQILIYSIAAIVALVGAIKIFIAWNSGERDVQKMVIGWFGACVFLVAIGAIIGAFFGAAAAPGGV